MWFKIFCAVLLLLVGFTTVFVGAIVFVMAIEYLTIAPLFSIFLAFGVIGIVTAGILMISGAGRKAREIKELYIN